MRVHHLNCGTLDPVFPPVPSICYCMLIDTGTDDGLILVDTGFGTADYLKPTRPVRFFMAANRMPRDINETAVWQIAGLGYPAEALQHIIMTHLHIDHAGGLPDFPAAKVHVHALERAAALERRRWAGWIEYIPAHWSHGPLWVTHDTPDGEWFGFDSIRLLGNNDYEVRLIPLHGHSPGHCGVAVRAGQDWLLLCGDEAYPFWNEQAMQRFGGKEPPLWLLKLVGSGTHVSRLKELWRTHGDRVRFMFSHDILTCNELRQIGWGNL